MKPEVALFTKDRPVTKKELWTCFRRKSGFVEVQVDEAHAVIGKNAPRYMERKEYLVKNTRADGDFYSLTPLGEKWLTDGIKSYVKNHPSERGTISFYPESKPAARRIVRSR